LSAIDAEIQGGFQIFFNDDIDAFAGLRISHTTTSKGLLVKSAVDTKIYKKGIEVSDAELANVKLKPHDFHGEWNYTVKK